MNGCKHEISLLQLWKLANEKGDDDRPAARNPLILSFLLVSSQGVHILLGTPVPDSTRFSERQLESRHFEFDLWYWLTYFLAHKSHFAFLPKAFASEGTHFRLGSSEQNNAMLRYLKDIRWVIFAALSTKNLDAFSPIREIFDLDLLTPWDNVFFIFQTHLNL